MDVGVLVVENRPREDGGLTGDIDDWLGRRRRKPIGLYRVRPDRHRDRARLPALEIAAIASAKEGSRSSLSAIGITSRIYRRGLGWTIMYYRVT